MLAPQAEFVNFVFLCESVQKRIILHKIPKTFSEDRAQPLPDPTPAVEGNAFSPDPTLLAPTAPLLHAFGAASTPSASWSGHFGGLSKNPGYVPAYTCKISTDKRVALSLCNSRASCSYPESYTAKLRQIFCVCSLWLWIGPLLTALRYIM